MMVHEITKAAGRRERRKRVGRGESSGMGRTSGRGNKGAQSRAGFYVPKLHIGGGQRVFAHLPKRGFNNFNFRVEYAAVNLAALDASFKSGDKVDGPALHEAGLLASAALPFKVLGAGSLTKKLAIVAHAVSADAKAAIEKAGGSIELLPQRDSAALWKAKRRTVSGKKREAGPSRLEKKRSAGKA